MIRTLLYLSVLVLFSTACKNAAPKVENQDKKIESGEDLNGAWYKRYSGTIAGHRVAVNLHLFAGRMAGAYSYTDKDMIVELAEAEKNDAAFNVYLNEYARAEQPERFYDDQNKPSNWAVNVRGNTVKGKWMTGAGTNTQGIDLKEDYPPGSYSPDIKIYGDSEQVTKGATHSQAISYYQLLQPSAKMAKADADFLEHTLLHLLGADTMGAQSLDEYVKKEDKKYFRNYRVIMNDMVIEKRTGHQDDWEYNFIKSRNAFIYYNDKGMLVLNMHDYQFNGGEHGHGYYVNNYSCVDMQEKRVWRLKDIMNLNTAKLLPLLDLEARRIFKLTAHDSLNNTLAVDAIPLTDNVYITGAGITFCYSPMVIGKEADGEICLFLPYSKIKDMLKDDFRKRMNL